jgi:hypothetical protein
MLNLAIKCAVTSRIFMIVSQQLPYVWKYIRVRVEENQVWLPRRDMDHLDLMMLHRTYR